MDFFSSLLKIKEGGELELLEEIIKSFVPNSKALVAAIATVFLGKSHR